MRGYSVIPEPRKVAPKSGDFALDESWRIERGAGVEANEPAFEDLKEQLAERYGLRLTGGPRAKSIELAIHPGTVEVGKATDADRASLSRQAYRLTLGPGGIRVTGNAPAGLFYGVQTLVQLLKRDRGRLSLPEAEITDWPDVGLRELFWDELEHLDHLDVLKQAVRRTAFFKANALALRLNGHFQYASAPALVDPYALTPAELQELTDYGLRHHVQVIPYLDGPAHVNFILEHDEYAHLREFPETAFQMCSTNPETYKLLEDMSQDLINATKGVEYFHLSTDEAWFVGKAENAQCNEVKRAKELGSPSKLLAEFIQKTAGYLQAHGRKVIFWGEHPLQAEDIPMLPSGLINGELFGPVYNKAFRARGIRQMIYTNSQPDDPLFPAYSVLSPNEQVHPRTAEERATRAFDEISYTAGRGEADIMGAGVYAWGDLGPHPETFWLGFAVGAAAAWHPASADPKELAQRFYRLYHGGGAPQVARIYQLLSTQAQFFASSWDSVASADRPLVFGYSYGIGPFTPHIQTLPLPPVPEAGYLRLGHDWAQANAKRLELAWKFLGQNDELLDLLYQMLPAVEWNRHSLEVNLSIARLCRQNLQLFQRLDEINKQLQAAQDQAGRLRYEQALGALDKALEIAGRMRDERNQALAEVAATWGKTWFPRVREANGRHLARNPQDFVDTATSQSAKRRQEGVAYLIEREFALPLGEWVNGLRDVRNRYAAAHNLPRREGKFDWQDSRTLRGESVQREL